VKSRVALRIYFLGLLQFVVVFVAMEVTRSIELRTMTPFGQKQGRFAAQNIARVYDDRAALDAELARIANTLDFSVEVRDPAGKSIARAQPTGLTPESERLPPAEVPITLADGRTATLVYAIHPPRPRPGLSYKSLVFVVLFIAGIFSFVAARTVTKPLAELAEATRAFGRGNLEARARMKRRDEIGEVARAFDDTADRVTAMLVAERELLGNISHELRTPLARIRVALDLANEADPAEATQSLADIAEDLAELERLVDDVLAAVRAQTPLGVRKEPIPLRGLLDKSITKFRSMHTTRELRAELPEELPVVEGDPIMMRRVFDNLLDNARKYSSSAIEIAAHGEKESVVVEVKDRGVGIAKEDLGRIFEPFFRADRSRTRATGGIGLGLALVKRVVDAHGGTIEFSSEVGAGTTARVSLPAVIR